MTMRGPDTEKLSQIPRGTGACCSPLDEGYLEKHCGEFDSRTARFILSLAFTKKAPWFDNNRELTNRLLAIAQRDRANWLPDIKEEGPKL